MRTAGLAATAVMCVTLTTPAAGAVESREIDINRVGRSFKASSRGTTR